MSCNTSVTVLSKRQKEDSQAKESRLNPIDEPSLIEITVEPKPFKLINSDDWVMIGQNPSSESTFFKDGHAAMSVISVLGTMGSGKSTLLNQIAGKQIFQTHSGRGIDFITKHVTRGIDIYTTHRRILLDCQPLLSSSVLEEFLCGKTKSQFGLNKVISELSISCHMISLQLATFLIAVSDYVIILLEWLVNIDLLKLLSSAIMMIGEGDIRARLVIYCPNHRSVLDDEFKILINNLLGEGVVEKYFDDEQKLIDYVTPYTDIKTDLHSQDPTKFTGHNWITSCNRIWNNNIRSSNMFADYANLMNI